MIFKVLLIIGLIIAVYAIIRNFDIIKIILNYWKDSILESNLNNFFTPFFFIDFFE